MSLQTVASAWRGSHLPFRPTRLTGSMRTSTLLDRSTPPGHATARAASPAPRRLFDDPAQTFLALWLALFALPWMLLARDLPAEEDEYPWVEAPADNR